MKNFTNQIDSACHKRLRVWETNDGGLYQLYADNFVANAGAGGSTFASDDISSVQYPRVKHSWGRDGVASDVGTVFRLISAASTNATSLKASAGTLYALYVGNTNAAARYFKLYNKASAPTVGTDTPVMTIMVPGNTAGAGVVVPLGPGADFSTGIAYATTTGAADSDTAAVAANEITANGVYV